jgi:hypothetical protein
LICGVQQIAHIRDESHQVVGCASSFGLHNVNSMLTRLACQHSADINRHRSEVSSWRAQH